MEIHNRRKLGCLASILLTGTLAAGCASQKEYRGHNLEYRDSQQEIKIEDISGKKVQLEQDYKDYTKEDFKKALYDEILIDLAGFLFF